MAIISFNRENFRFQPSWMKNKEYWDKTFEDRYERQKMDPERPPLKVRHYENNF